MIKHLTGWVLKEVPRHWTAWRERGLDLRISVNLTSQELLDPALPEKIKKALKPHNMPFDRLSFEVSESGVMEDPITARTLMKVVADLGVTIAIDNFGTGYSSLAYLKQLPVHEIKIDHSFVGDMHLNEQKIVRSMIKLGHNLGLRVVADGVTSEESYQKLCDFGCDFLQGSVVNVAVPAGEIVLWLERSKWKVERHLQTA
jgi:EAL domain-containing protein (putative c-di-GMP-specific phosphodiesterase class I)